MKAPFYLSASALFLGISSAPLAAQTISAPVTPSSITETAPNEDWKSIPPEDLVIFTLQGAKQVIVQIAPPVSAGHVANFRTLAADHWWDGTAVYRVQDNYVVQWGDLSEEKPLPDGMPTELAEEYSQPMEDAPSEILKIGHPDSYAEGAGFMDGWPVAFSGDEYWLPHCYGMVGAGRGLSPDAGNGAELYAVIGHAPRHLDRNIALVGRVVEGMEYVSSLARGHGELGFYTEEEKPTPVVSVRLASELPLGERPQFQYLDTASRSFADYVRTRANRKDAFFFLPAGGVDLCNVNVPIRRIPLQR